MSNENKGEYTGKTGPIGHWGRAIAVIGAIHNGQPEYLAEGGPILLEPEPISEGAIWRISVGGVPQDAISTVWVSDHQWAALRTPGGLENWTRQRSRNLRAAMGGELDAQGYTVIAEVHGLPGTEDNETGEIWNCCPEDRRVILAMIGGFVVLSEMEADPTHKDLGATGPVVSLDEVASWWFDRLGALRFLPPGEDGPGTAIRWTWETWLSAHQDGQDTAMWWPR